MGWSTADVPDQTGRTALVTGANSGLGFQVSRVLADRGARVLLGCRSQERGEDALRRLRQVVPAARVELLELDLASLTSVRVAAAEARRRLDGLDLLFDNAGVMALPHDETADGFERQLGTNHLGHFALTGLLLPLLLAAPAARVVVTSSLAHHMGKIDFDDLMGRRSYSRWGAYGQSKLANLLFTFELQRRFAAADVPAIAVAAHPGYSATNLQHGPAVGSRIPGMGLLMKVANLLLGQSDEAGALPLLRAGTDPDVTGGDYYGPTGLREIRGAPGRVGTSGRARDEETARRLWEVSEMLTGVRYDLARAVR